jgi:hypothetical protein
VGLVIADSVTPTQLLGVEATPRAARVIIYGPDGNPVSAQNSAAVVPLTQGGMINAGRDYKLAKTIRASPDGTLRTSDDAIMLYDSCEGAAVNIMKWIQTTTTMTITQAVATGMLFNAGSSVATTVGAMQASHKRYPFISRSALAFRFRARATAHFSNNLIEMGAVNPPATATTAAVPDGFFWRKDAAGQWLPVMSISGVETLGTPISNATFIAAVATTDYCYFAVFVEEERATFRITTNAGVIVTEQIIDFSAASGIGTFAVTHLAAFIRTWNSGATGTAVQLFVSQVAVFAVDSLSQRDWKIAMSGMLNNSTVSPTTGLQLAQYANSADPAAAVLSNTAASYTTLGGLFLGPTPTPAGAVTDFALFGWANPSSNLTFFLTGIKIQTANRGAAVATTATRLEWALGFNSSAVSLATAAPYSPMKVSIGAQAFAIGAAIDAVAPDVVWTPGTPLPVMPSRFLHVILRIPVGTATAAGFLRGSVAIDGFFE